MMALAPALILGPLFPITYLLVQRHHLLMALLYLELMILMFAFFFAFISDLSAIFVLLIVLSFGACEASLGLALLISLMRAYGSDVLNQMVINKC